MTKLPMFINGLLDCSKMFLLSFYFLNCGKIFLLLRISRRFFIWLLCMHTRDNGYQILYWSHCHAATTTVSDIFCMSFICMSFLYEFYQEHMSTVALICSWFYLCKLCESSASHIKLYWINFLSLHTLQCMNTKMHKCKFLKRLVLTDLHNLFMRILMSLYSI